jgi:hypothetical protein
MDFLYTKKKKDEEIVEETQAVKEVIAENDVEIESETDVLEIIEEEDEDLILEESISDIVAKVRQLGVQFHRSPLKNEVLQKHLKREFNRELELILDSKTRWNSLAAMIQRFVQIEKCVRMTLIEFGGDISVTSNEVKVLKIWLTYWNL